MNYHLGSTKKRAVNSTFHIKTAEYHTCFVPEEGGHSVCLELCLVFLGRFWDSIRKFCQLLKSLGLSSELSTSLMRSVFNRTNNKTKKFQLCEQFCYYIAYCYFSRNSICTKHPKLSLICSFKGQNYLLSSYYSKWRQNDKK